MICVDTSVWIEFLRGRDHRLISTLNQYLDDDVVILSRLVFLEILNGASSRDATVLRRNLSALPILDPLPSTWDVVEGWVDAARSKGERFGIVDLLIAAQAHEKGATVWSLDADFQRMAKLKLVRVVSR